MATGGNARAKLEDDTEPPWYRWREKDPAKRCIRFIETYCRSPKGVGYGKPVKLADWQKWWIKEEALAAGIRQAVLSAPRGQGKSTLLAAIAVWATFDLNETGQPIVPIMATTVGQAARAVYDVACKMVAAEPELDKRALVYTAISSAKIVVGYNGGECFPIANGVDGLQGLDPTCAIVDEIGFQSPASWQAMVLASGKRERSLVVGIGTPGVDRDKSALWHLREVYRAGNAPHGFSFTELSAPDDCDWRDEANWLLANPAIVEGYLSIEALRTDVAMSPEAAFRMFRLGQWVEGVDCWLGVDGRKVWQGLKSDYELVPGADTWVGLDVGLSQDTTAVVVGQRTPTGKLHTTVRIWHPVKDQAIDVSVVQAHLRKLDQKYNLVEVAYDPRHFELPATTLADEGLPMVEFPQSPERMVPACGDLYRAIMRGEISHDGAADYERQILNAMPTYTDTGFRLSKKNSRGKIDAAIALALCHDRAQHPAPKKHKLVAALIGG